MESIGELIEKLVIANIKLWMVKDAQTAIACSPAPELAAVQQQLAQLSRTETLSAASGCRANELQTLVARLEELTKLAPSGLLTELKQLVVKDIELCEARAAFRRAIDKRLGDTTPADTVKQYGQRPSPLP